MVAARGDTRSRVVVFAHNSRMGRTSDANDSASGVAVLLPLAGPLTDHRGSLDVELVAKNGEDYCSNPGEQP